jgi:hypothetical protein
MEYEEYESQPDLDQEVQVKKESMILRILKATYSYVLFIIYVIFLLSLIGIIIIIVSFQLPNKTEYNFIIIGNWGTGSDYQKNIAFLMNETSKNMKIDAIITTYIFIHKK